jgi:hypothetical protein
MNAKIKKLIREGKVGCAYVYKDCIAIKENKVFTCGKLSTTKDYYHVVDSNHYTYNRKPYNDETKYLEPKRFVFHNPTLLIDGITRIDVWHNNSSIRMEELGLKVLSIIIETQGGMRISDNNVIGAREGDIVPQPSELSFNDWYHGPTCKDELIQSFKDCGDLYEVYP